MEAGPQARHAGDGEVPLRHRHRLGHQRARRPGRAARGQREEPGEVPVPLAGPRHHPRPLALGERTWDINKEGLANYGLPRLDRGTSACRRAMRSSRTWPAARRPTSPCGAGVRGAGHAPGAVTVAVHARGPVQGEARRRQRGAAALRRPAAGARAVPLALRHPEAAGQGPRRSRVRAARGRRPGAAHRDHGTRADGPRRGRRRPRVPDPRRAARRPQASSPLPPAGGATSSASGTAAFASPG